MSQGAATGRRGRRSRASSEDVLASLTAMVDKLIDENRQLKRAVARAERAAGDANLGQAAKTLSGLQRRVSRALTAPPATRQRRGGSAQSNPRPRPKVTDPEVLERRRQALSKARAALAAKRQASSG
jgi:hypothetical protein